jgi:hypothetical protein
MDCRVKPGNDDALAHANTSRRSEEREPFFNALSLRYLSASEGCGAPSGRVLFLVGSLSAPRLAAIC